MEIEIEEAEKKRKGREDKDTKGKDKSVLGLAPGSNEPRVTGDKYTGDRETAEQPVFAQSGQRLPCVGEGKRGQRDGDCHLAVTHDTRPPPSRNNPSGDMT
jgi:hypothetical protein